ncbi:MAG TPA: universal stress protein [Devosia sp.]|nr:universal stress protein [Devosia sp.]
MYKRILIATDGSDLASRALDHGLALAKALAAEVTIMTATEFTVAVGGSAEFTYLNSGELFTELEKAKAVGAQAILSAAKQRAEALEIPAKVLHIPQQHAADAIVETAEQHGSDLIVMGSHGRRGIGRLLLGSQAAEVLARSQIPVLIVK